MNKIINIRGTSGSGKSHLMRTIMSKLIDKQPVTIEGRKQPLYYRLNHPSGAGLVSVLGHYECACGGCDTISSGTEGIFQLAREQAAYGHVVMEGLLISSEVTRTVALTDCAEVHVIFLDTPIADCLAGINARRVARGVMEPVNPKNTEGKHRNCAQVLKRLKRDYPQVNTWQLNRADALAKVCELLNLN